MNKKILRTIRSYTSVRGMPHAVFVVGGVVALCLVVIGGMTLFSQSEEIKTVQVRSNALGADVSVQGTIVPRDEVVLSFETSGRVAAVYAEVGGTVVRGETIAVLAQDDIYAQIQNLQAVRDTAKVELENLKAGVRAEDIAVAESALASAKNQETQAYTVLGQTLENAFAILDDAVRTKTDQFFDNPHTATPHLTIPSDSEPRLQVERERTALELTLQGVQYRSFVEPSEADIERVRSAVRETRTFLDHMASIVNDMENRSSLSATIIDTYRTLIATARTVTASYNIELTAALTAYTNAQAAVQTAEAQLALKKAGPTAYDIDAQEARVRAAQATLDATQALVRQHIITAPFTGTITDISFSKGEVVSPNASAGVTLISEQELEVESFIPEVYIARIAVGDEVSVSLDAYPESESFGGHVAFIDPSSTIKDGVSTYRITITLSKVDERVKAGMNGDVHIKASQNPNIITIPKTVLINRNGRYYVQIPVDKTRIVEREVIVGSFNEAGVAEIISGLVDGDEIVLNPTE